MSSPLPEPEELFGKYELVARIATGGMAEIFRAVSSSIGGFQKVVALKRILPHLSTDAEFVSLFIAEAKLAVALTHSNIVQVLDFGKVEQSHYIAMEFVEGKDLTQILIKQSRARKQVPVEAACYMLAETARALEYAHARKDRDGSPLGIVHRDVSPHNILVSYDGEVKLTDFGIAKAKNHVTLSKPGVILGKFAYMSPEQAHGELIDARTDIYAAGITLYETLTGRRLFYSEDPLQTLALTVSQHMGLGTRWWQALGASKAVTARCEVLLAQFHLTEVMDQPTRVLAYGKRRLLEIAIALACEPSVLLLDEPVAGVPAGEREELLQTVADLPADVSVLLIEHDMDLVFSFARRMTVLVNGAVLTEGDPQQIANDPEVRAVYLGSTEATHG